MSRTHHQKVLRSAKARAEREAERLIKKLPKSKQENLIKVRIKVCPNCEGTGEDPIDSTEGIFRCPECGGTGEKR